MGSWESGVMGIWTGGDEEKKGAAYEQLLGGWRPRVWSVESGQERKTAGQGARMRSKRTLGQGFVGEGLLLGGSGVLLWVQGFKT